MLKNDVERSIYKESYMGIEELKSKKLLAGVVKQGALMMIEN